MGKTRDLFKKIRDTRGTFHATATATAKSLQSCLTLCDPIDGSPPGSPVPGILQARTLEWGAVAFSNAKMGTIKDRNGMDLTEAEDIKNRWQEYIEELYKKDLHDPDNHDGVITPRWCDLESDILESEVKWALGSITVDKASGGDGIPAELFQILKDDAV